MDAVSELLDRQGGLARRRELVKAGLSRRALDRRVRSGALRALTPTLFTDRDQPVADDELRRTAVALSAVVSHTSAALLWGLELAATPAHRSVTVPRSRTRVQHDGTQVTRRELGQDEIVLLDGVRVTTVLRTLVDLCRSLPLAHAVAAADSALRKGLVTLEELQQALCVLPAAVGRPAVARAVALCDPRCGSVLESLTRVLLAEHGLRPPQTQLAVWSQAAGVVGRVDFAWEHLRLVVETDGFAFHSDRRRYREDRRRGNALVRAGWTVLRFSWEDVVHYPEYVVETVAALVADLTGMHRT